MDDEILTSDHLLLYATLTLLLLTSHSHKALLSIVLILQPSIEVQPDMSMSSKVARHSSPCACLKLLQLRMRKCNKYLIVAKDGISTRL
jgi:hypothetical protein